MMSKPSASRFGNLAFRTLLSIGRVCGDALNLLQYVSSSVVSSMDLARLASLVSVTHPPGQLLLIFAIASPNDLRWFFLHELSAGVVREPKHQRQAALIMMARLSTPQ
ncbi:hypothetical protein HD554DRAFT_1033087 [Boletus coccyginus]|nr:hypothetical protein HD554DRAFT_1033087 [Boletus coccyginus]